MQDDKRSTQTTEIDAERLYRAAISRARRRSYANLVAFECGAAISTGTPVIDLERQELISTIARLL